ncbi:hypothetical protein EAI_06942 [Harpegnathos saltator]|uniref:Reverse transcriptase zinc-binding domain-containing protein n=1 Tax=Harpegnathos saltator TaxID=610380 RepID=E2BYD4_HARSA|nr:hypothetical protein EAI_06942 [Harpegnathos saltator]
MVREGNIKYLLKNNLSRVGNKEGVKALARLRCSNMEEGNKYWLKEEYRKCVFCIEGWDTVEHYIRECRKIKGWFVELGKNEENRLKRIWDDELDEKKGVVLKKL